MDAPQLRLRDSPRIAVEARARLRFAGGGAPLDAVALDLSASGMGLATPVATPKPAAGELCTFELTLDGVTVEGTGVVIWSRRARPDRGDAVNVGVRFERLDGAGQRAVGTLIERGLEGMRRPPPVWKSAAAQVSASEPLVAVAAPEPAAAITPAPSPAAATAPPSVARAPVVPDPIVPAPIAPPVPIAPPAPIDASAPMAAPAATTPPAPIAAATAFAAGAAIPAPAPLAAPPDTRDPAPRAQSPPAPAPEAAPSGPRRTAHEGRPSRPRLVVWIAAAIVLAAVAALLAGRLLRRAPATGAPELSPAVAVAAGAGSDEPARRDAASALETAPRLAPAASASDDAARAVSADDTGQADSAIGVPKTSEPGRASAPVAPDTAPPGSRTNAPPSEPSSTRSAGSPAEPPAPGSRARRLLALEPSADASGETLVLRADGPIRRQDVFAALIGPDPPRYLLRISGIEQPWRPADLAVGSPLIAQVRTGLHPTPRGSELHVVLDLTSRAVEPSWEIEGDQLRVHLHAKTP